MQNLRLLSEAKKSLPPSTSRAAREREARTRLARPSLMENGRRGPKNGDSYPLPALRSPPLRELAKPFSANPCSFTLLVRIASP